LEGSTHGLIEALSQNLAEVKRNTTENIIWGIASAGRHLKQAYSECKSAALDHRNTLNEATFTLRHYWKLGLYLYGIAF